MGVPISLVFFVVSCALVFCGTCHTTNIAFCVVTLCDNLGIGAVGEGLDCVEQCLQRVVEIHSLPRSRIRMRDACEFGIPV